MDKKSISESGASCGDAPETMKLTGGGRVPQRSGAAVFTQVAMTALVVGQGGSFGGGYAGKDVVRSNW